MKILLADDSWTMRSIQKRALADLGDVQFSEAADGVDALTVISAVGPFDLILVDWNMPNMDGITLVRRVRKNDKKTVMIMVTTEAEKDHVVEAIKAGVNNYAIKPFTQAALLDKIKVTLARAHATAVAAA